MRVKPLYIAGVAVAAAGCLTVPAGAVGAAPLRAPVAAVHSTTTRSQVGEVSFMQKPFTIGGKTINIFVGPPTSGGGGALTSGLGGRLWYPIDAFGASYIFSLTTKGKATIYPIPTGGSNAIGIAEGPDGVHMWFTEDGGSYRYASLTANGTFTQYPITGNPNMSQIIAGPDKRLWFGISGIMEASDESGNLSPYNLPNANDFQDGMTVGPDGNIWYTQNSGFSSESVGSITTAGVPTDYSLGFRTTGIAVGSNKNLWFGVSGAAEVASVNTQGTGLTTYTSGISGAPSLMVEGPDGNIYFSEYVSGTQQAALAKIAPTGKVTEYALPYGFVPSAVAVGPDSNIWVLDTGHDQLGQLVLKK